jgi:hypothetical protein
MTKSKIILYMLIMVLSGITCLLAQTPEANTNPGKWKLSFSERVRIETWDNSVTLSRAANAGNSYLRSRTSLMGQWIPSESFEAGVKLTNEFRNYFAPSTNMFHMNEVFFDQLYIKWNTKSILDGVLTIGRQNIILGEGFVVMDSSPLDGSRSVYFNAIRYDLNLDKKNGITFFGMYQPKIDKLTVLNGNDIDPSFQGDGTWMLIEQAEAGAGIYYTGKFTDVNLQSYYIRKDYVDPDAKLGQIKSDVNTLGSRVNAALNKNFSATLEGAYQFGNSGDYKRNSFGGYWYVDYNLLSEKTYLPKTFTVGMIYLSGDDPGTKDNEGWDPIFSRWPKWSESFIYTQIKEFSGKPAYWSNIISYYASLKFSFDSQVNFAFDYHHLSAPQSGVATSFIGTGNVRGDLFIGKLLFDVNKNISGHIIFEHFIPGDYYFSGANVSNWARMELSYKI